MVDVRPVCFLHTGMGLVYACLLQLSNGIPRVCMSALQLVAPWNSSSVDMLRTISESIVKSAGSGSTSWRFFWKHHRKTCNFMNARFVFGVLFLFLDVCPYSYVCNFSLGLLKSNRSVFKSTHSKKH